MSSYMSCISIGIIPCSNESLFLLRIRIRILIESDNGSQSDLRTDPGFLLFHECSDDSLGIGFLFLSSGLRIAATVAAGIFEVVDLASFVGCGKIGFQKTPPSSVFSLGSPSRSEHTFNTNRRPLFLSLALFYIEAAEGSRTLVTSLGSSGNSRYTTAAVYAARAWFITPKRFTRTYRITKPSCNQDSFLIIRVSCYSLHFHFRLQPSPEGQISAAYWQD